MSYHAYLTADCGGTHPAEVEDCGGHTYNCAPMFRHAFDSAHGVNLLDGLPAASAAALLDKAIFGMECCPDVYRAMNPANGYGSYGSALAWLKCIKAACERYPKATLVIA
jgi:hypothetical protein